MTAMPSTAPAATQGHHRRVWLLAAVLAMLTLLAASAGLNRAIGSLISDAGDIIGHHPVAGGAVFMALAAISAMLAFFSSAIVVPLGVQHWGAPLTALLLLAGWLTGGIAAWFVGRYLGEPVVRRIIKPHYVQYYQDWIGHRTPFGVILLFQSAAPSEITGYILGMARYPLGRYVAGRAIAELPFAAGAVLLGEQFLRGNYGMMIAVGGVGMALLAVGLDLLHRQVVAHRAGRTAQPPA